VLTITLVSFSQKEEEEDKIEKLRIAFLTEELDLSVEDAQKFWPIYNDHQTIKKQIDSETKAMMKKMKRLEKPNDAVVRQSIDEMSDLKLSGVKSEIEYLTQSLEVLGGEKTLKLIYSEKEFRRRVLKRLRESRREQDPNDREGEKRPKEPARK
jgi:Spy/CpxP family protein refolding chaperone